jgi:hypothetical protein
VFGRVGYGVCAMRPVSRRADGQSLSAFAQANPPQHGEKCTVCSMPEVDEINKGRLAGLMPVTIHKWLTTDRGYTKDRVTVTRLYYHFKSGHHQR